MRAKASLVLGFGFFALTVPVLPVLQVEAQQQTNLEQVIPINMPIKDAAPPREIPVTRPPSFSSSPAPPPPTPPPTPPPPPPVVVQPPPVLRPSTPFSPPIVVPTDTSYQGGAAGGLPAGKLGGVLPPNAPPVSDGIQILADNQFPEKDESKQPTDGILVRAKDNAQIERPNSYSVKLVSGTILVSVRRPSRLGMITTPLADVALSADGDLLISEEHGVLHILNASARGLNCKIKLHKAEFASSRKHTFAIKPGFEFTACQTKLSRANLRPADGIARRRTQVFEDGRIALSEFSVHGLLVHHELVASLNQKDMGTKERRILGDLSKMAAVLNQVNGSTGYHYSAPSRLASAPQAQAQPQP